MYERMCMCYVCVFCMRWHFYSTQLSVSTYDYVYTYIASNCLFVHSSLGLPVQLSICNTTFSFYVCVCVVAL